MKAIDHDDLIAIYLKAKHGDLNHTIMQQDTVLKLVTELLILRSKLSDDYDLNHFVKFNALELEL